MLLGNDVPDRIESRKAVPVISREIDTPREIHIFQNDNEDNKQQPYQVKTGEIERDRFPNLLNKFFPTENQRERKR